MIKAAQNQYEQSSPDKDPFNFILRSIMNEPDRMWTSTELLEAYKRKGGTESNNTRFVNRIKQYLNDEIYCFMSPGIATIIMHKHKASTIFKV